MTRGSIDLEKLRVAGRRAPVSAESISRVGTLRRHERGRGAVCGRSGTSSFGVVRVGAGREASPRIMRNCG